MRLLPVVLFLTAATWSAPAQTNENKFQKWDGSREAWSRGHLGSSKGWLSQAFPPGILGGARTLTYVQYLACDNNMFTQEPWRLEICGLDQQGRPDYPNSRPITPWVALPRALKIAPALITHSFRSNFRATVPVTDEQWHLVWNFRQNTNWFTDGLYIGLSTADPNTSPSPLCRLSSSTFPFHREIPRVDAQALDAELAWSWSPRTGQAEPLPQSWLLTLGFDEVTLDGGMQNATYNTGRLGKCQDPNFGYASLDPDFADFASANPARYDNFVWKVAAGSGFAGGTALLFWSTTTLSGGIATPFGRFFLDPRDPLFALGPIAGRPLDASGGALLALDLGAASSPLRRVASSIPSWSAQAVVLKSQVRLSTLFTFRPVVAPPGFQRGTATAAAPALIRRSGNDFTIRNDGRGVLRVAQLKGNVVIGPATVVPERTMARIALAPAATALRVASNKTRPTHFVHR